jgi:hypothetical protein
MERTRLRLVCLFIIITTALLLAACRGPTWQVGSQLLVTNRQVQEALNDPLSGAPEPPFNPNAAPLFDAPGKTRPCCPFGMDLKVKVGAVTVPGYAKDNILDLHEIGKHEYDNGAVTVQSQSGRGLLLENNGILYTCRGGFIDVAHIRDNADLMLFLTMRLARGMPGPFTIELPDQGTKRRVLVKKIPEDVIKHYGRIYAASAMAQWLTYYLSIWHEVVTWYDWQSVKGFSEKLSAFSPEDNYSNVLGILIASGVIRNQGAQSRDEYNHSIDAWIPAALRRLGVVSEQDTRAATKAVDGLWWTSAREVPDPYLVLKRNLEIKLPLSGKNAEGVDPRVHKMCEGAAEPLELHVSERLGRLKFSDALTVEFEFTESFMPENFPYPRGRKLLTQADVPAVIEGIRKDVLKELGPGADEAKPAPQAPRVSFLEEAPPRHKAATPGSRSLETGS